MIPLVRDIGILVIFLGVAGLFTWFVLKPSLTQQRTVPNEIPLYMPQLITNYKDNPQDYLHPRLIKAFPSSSPTEVGLVVEWFNCSAFGMKFESVGGEVWMGELNSDPASLGHQITLSGDPSLSASRTCTCTLFVQASPQAIEQFRDSIARNRALIWKLNLTWRIYIDYLQKPISVQQAPTDAITLLPSRS